MTEEINKEESALDLALKMVNDGMLMCNICGKLFQNLSGHLWMSHKMKARDYKAKFGLAWGNALVSESERMRLKQATLDWLKNLSEEDKARHFKKMKEKDRKPRRRPQPTETLEDKNKKGTCPDQLLDKIVECSQELGHTPSKSDFIIWDNGSQRYVHLIYKMFGSWSNALDMTGLQPKIQHQNGGYRKYNEDELIKYLQDFTIMHKAIPTHTDFKRKVLPSAKTYTRHFGSVEIARQEAKVYEILDNIKLSEGTNDTKRTA